MYVYIDESGIFSNPANRKNIASCVSALVIPGSQQDEIFAKFQQLLSSWSPPGVGREIKGSKLNEGQIARVVSLLQQNEVVLDTIAIDLGLHTEDEITDFRTRQANNLIANLTPEHHPNLVRQAHQQRDYLLRMKNPLFVQAFLFWLLIPRLFEKVTLYYSRRIPEELGEFHWIIDAKDKRITEFEESWSTLIHPTVSNYGREHPLTMLEGGDYSHLDRYLETDEQLLADVRQEHGLGDEELDVLSFNKVFGDSLVFGNSSGSSSLIYWRMPLNEH
jgi:hypothetical protein